MAEIVKIGDATLYLGDCMEFFAEYPCLKVNAVITDPPYGIKWDSVAEKDSGRKPGNSAAKKGEYISTGWDDEPMSIDIANHLISMSSVSIFWGGNYYGLPASQCWLVWDKKTGNNQFADCELAWTNIQKPVRKFEWMWNGMLRQGGEERNGHPTQKPLALMKWCIEQAGNPETIFDPFMGSGTTGVAAIQMGSKFIGIEREPKYFEIACKRIEQASKQVDMFIEQPKHEQVALL